MTRYPAWFIAADTGGARFFVRLRPDLPLEEREDLADTPDLVDHRHDPEHDDPGHGQHTIMARAPLHEQAERQFLRRVAGQIDRAVNEDAVESLVLCAPPRALGLLRDFISQTSRRTIWWEINSDALKEPVGRLDERMKEHGL